MAPTPSPRAASARRSRTSIAHPISAEVGTDKENQTIHGMTTENGSRKPNKRGLRSQSLGPGGIEALGEATGNRQKVQPLPRSILKPTIPLSPPKTIPQHPSQAGRSPRRKSAATSPARSVAKGADQTSSKSVENGSPEVKHAEPGTKIGLKSEEEQQAAARERERLEAQERRDERRKSLANRRVSFAPEATLHTWDVVELPEDATSSSEATNSTRRSTLPASPYPDHTRQHDLPSSPSAPDGTDVQVAASPATLADAKRKQQRRSSGGATQPQDLSSSPVSSTGSDDTHQSFVTGEDDIVDESDTDEDRDLEAEETITSVDNDDDATGNTTSLSDTNSVGMDSSDALDRALREATRLAVMQRTTAEQPFLDATGVDGDEQGKDVSDSPAGQRSMMHPAQQESDAQDGSEDEEMTMEVTQSLGVILPPSSTERSPTRREKRKSLSRRRSSAGQAANADDETMEFTTAIGGIQTMPSARTTPNAQEAIDSQEEMTMDFTTTVGGVVATADSERSGNLYQSDDVSLVDDNDMDITVARGTILSPVTERTEPSENSTMGMDFTAAVGSILPEGLHSATKTEAKMLMEEEADHGQLTRSPFSAAHERLSPAPLPSHGSPSRNARKLVQMQQATALRSPAKQTTPLRKVATPTKQVTPKPARPTTPSKTPPPKNVSMRTTSPKRLFKESKPGATARQIKSPKSAPKSAPGKVSQKSLNSLSPPVILTPKARRSSGMGIDQVGMGSPKVAAKLDRRSSIGEQAAAFTSRGISHGVVRFQDPREMAQQLENERAEEARRESGRGVLEQEVNARPTDDVDNTGSLREMIGGLTPKKNRLNGRKSLATGGAKGLLGKRPRELDEDDEDATPKKLKGKDQSPVKSVFLPAPPSKDETTGRLGKAPIFSLSINNGKVQTPTTQSPPKATASSPGTEGRFRDTKTFMSAEEPPTSFNEQLEGSTANPANVLEDEPIHLRDFLNMTSIRFMELTTTKRRHTVAPGKGSATPGDDTVSGSGAMPNPADDRRLGACVAAGASTIPMLELYQHSCRELKKYISEGRSIVHEIEDDTYEENPPLFREYLTASPQVRSLMDNQFKNVKTHARLLSREMWYEWRMKLLDGLKEGLDRIQTGLNADDAVLSEQERVLEGIMPQLQKQNEELHEQASNLQDQADELASCDPNELKQTREELLGTEKTIASLLKQIEKLEAQVGEKTGEMEQMSQRKAECLTDIAEAERVREELRGWNAAEVKTEKAKVDEIERRTGWTIVSAHNGSIELVYRSEIALYLNPFAFKSSQPAKAQNSTISLSFAGEDDECTTTYRFFLQLLRARLHSMPQAETSIRQVLGLVENGWHLASQIGSQVKDMKAAWPTQEVILSDEVLQITSTMLLRNYRTKIDASFEISMGGTGSEITAAIHPQAKSVYGQELKQEKMADVLSNESGLRGAGDKIDSWSNALETLEKKLNRFLAGKEKH